MSYIEADHIIRRLPSEHFKSLTTLLQSHGERPLIRYRSLITNAVVQLAVKSGGNWDSTLEFPTPEQEDATTHISIRDMITSIMRFSHAISRKYFGNDAMDEPKKTFNRDGAPDILTAGMAYILGGNKGEQVQGVMEGFEPSQENIPFWKIEEYHNTAIAWALANPLDDKNVSMCAGVPQWMLDEEQLLPTDRLDTIEIINSQLLTGRFNSQAY